MSAPRRPKPSRFLQFTNLGFQMAGLIAAGALGGDYLDRKQQNELPWWTLGLTLLGLFAAFYQVFGSLRDMNREDSE